MSFLLDKREKSPYTARSKGELSIISPEKASSYPIDRRALRRQNQKGGEKASPTTLTGKTSSYHMKRRTLRQKVRKEVKKQVLPKSLKKPVLII
jgi:hypothetical protein